MNVGVIIPELRKYGGAEKLLIECLRRWQYLHEITVYAMGFREELLEEHGVTDIVMKQLTPYFTGGEHDMLLNSVLLPKIWEREIGHHDVYHTHLWPLHLLNLHPMVWYPHEPLRVINDLKYEQSLLTTPFETKRALHTYPKADYDEVRADYFEAYQAVITSFDKTGHPDKILANSKYTAKYLSGIYGVKDVDVVYPGINREDFFYQPPDENIILNVNQLWPHKRVNLIIQAMQYVENGQLYIVGQGPEKKNLEKYAKELGVSERVFFLGNVTNEELAILYGRALCVAFVPVREPFGIVALEAMAAGKPLVAVNEGGYTEAVTNGKEGFLVNAVPYEIAEKINYLLLHKDAAVQMGQAGLKSVGSFTWQQTADGILHAIEEAFKTRRKIEVTSSESRLIGIDYFVWYGKGYGAEHWNDNEKYGCVTQSPLLGYYSSDSGEIIRQHLKMLEGAGVDYIAVNLHIDEQGLNVYQYQVAKRIMDIIEEDHCHIRVCVQICPYTADIDKCMEGIEYILEHMVHRESYVLYEGKPLVFLFWTGSMDGDRESIECLRQAFRDTVLIASSMRIYNKADEESKTFGLFDGWSVFSPLQLSSDDGERRNKIDEIYQQYEAGRKKIKVFTCSPVYDDRKLKDRGSDVRHLRYIDREHGNVFRWMLDMAGKCEPQPDIIKITTFNEFHENTHIEPTIEHGMLYMDILREYISRWKGGNANEPEETTCTP